MLKYRIYRIRLPSALRHSLPLQLRQCSTAARAMSVQQPPWSVPIQQSQAPVLKVYNSLTKTKVRVYKYLSICISDLRADRVRTT
jgi:hypothetical protein